MASSSKQPLRVLCLHGLNENGEIMKRKLSSMTQQLPPNDFEFVYLSAPFVVPGAVKAPVKDGDLSTNDKHKSKEERIDEQDKEHKKACLATSYLLAVDHYKWAEQHRKESKKVSVVDELDDKYTALRDSFNADIKIKAQEHISESSTTSRRWWTLPTDFNKYSAYIGQEVGFARISKAMREQGPFDGVIGFSSGAMMAAYCQALLQGAVPNSMEPTFQPPPDQTPFRFAIHIAPWLTAEGQYAPYFEALERNTSIHTPALCFEGVRDRHCTKGSCGQFAACIGAERFEYHSGGHSIPMWDDYPAFMADWLSLAGKECRGQLNKDEAKRARLRLKSPFKELKSRQNDARL